MTKKGMCLLYAALAAMLLTGCGGEHRTQTAGDKTAVSGPAVSGQVVDFAEAKEHPYCTDTNLYVDVAYDADNTSGYRLIQRRLDATHEKEIELDGFFELIRLTGGYLYYETAYDPKDSDEIEKCGICRVPVEKDDDGWDVIRSDKVEKLVSLKEPVEVYSPDSRYIYYEVEDNNGQLTRYDLDSGEKVSMSRIPGSDDGGTMVLSGHLQIFVLTWDGLFMPDGEGTRWSRISDSRDIFWNLVDWDENAFFYVAGHNNPGKKIKESEAVRKIDLAGGKEREFIKKERLGQEAIKVLGVSEDQLDGCWITDLFCEGNRLYIQMQLNWSKNNDYCIDHFIFSQGMDETEIRYERELTECMQNHGVFNEEGKKVGGLEQSLVWNDANCYEMVNGKAFLCLYNYVEDKGHVGYYDLETGVFSWMTKKDAVYYEPCYDYCKHFYSDSVSEYLEAEETFAGFSGIGYLPGDKEDFDDDEYVQKKMY